MTTTRANRPQAVLAPPSAKPDEPLERLVVDLPAVLLDGARAQAARESKSLQRALAELLDVYVGEGLTWRQRELRIVRKVRRTEQLKLERRVQRELDRRRREKKTPTEL